MACAPGRGIYMLTLGEVEDGFYVHVCKHRRDIRGPWAKFDLISAKLTKTDLDFLSKFPSILKNPEMYKKTRSIAFPAYLSPHKDIQLCYVMHGLQNDSEMRFVKSLSNTFQYECKISEECPWLKGNYKNYDKDLDGLYMEMPPEDQLMYILS